MRKYGTILIIEDDPDLGAILSDTLSPHFEKVIYCTNGADALAAIEQNTLSVILTDYNMPKANGDQVLRQMRSKGNLTPVIFLTGAATIEICLSALRLGAGDVLTKPCSNEDLLASIDRVLEIEKRKQKYYSVAESNSEETIKSKKMIGLLQVVNEKRVLSK